MNKFTVNVFQILICQGAGVCCPGLYPFVFPSNGYKGQLAWMESFSVIGPKAIKILHSAAKEGELSLPKFVAIKLLSGKCVQLGPDLLTPGSYQLSRHPSLSVVIAEENFLVKHTSPTVKECELGELEDSDEGLHIDFDAENVILTEKKNESESCDIVGKTLRVGVSGEVETEQLVKHFSDFGELESVERKPDDSEEAVIRFQKLGVVHQLDGQEHLLPEGQVRLRLRGGDGRLPAPSRQQQHNLNPFR